MQKQHSADVDRTYGVLWDIFGNVNAQLQFAETKNGALVTVNLALVVAIGTMLAGDDVAASDVRTWLFVTAVGLAGAALVSLLSFLPHLGGDTQVGTSGNTPSNLIYFADLADAGLPEFIAAVQQAAGQLEVTRLHTDLGHQIIVNSGIARRKFAAFRIAAVATVLCATMPAVVLAFAWVGNGGVFK